MSKRITVDPITRIEGHLRIDVEVDGGKVTKAWSSGQMFRGIETILQGRDPREAWLFTQRFCGVCTTVHALASVRCVENAVKVEVPLNAQYIRNIILVGHGGCGKTSLAEGMLFVSGATSRMGRSLIGQCNSAAATPRATPTPKCQISTS